MRLCCLYVLPKKAHWVRVDVDTIKLWARNNLLAGTEIMVRE